MGVHVHIHIFLLHPHLFSAFLFTSKLCCCSKAELWCCFSNHRVSQNFTLNPEFAAKTVSALGFVL